MKKLQKIFIFLLTAAMLWSLCACGNSSPFSEIEEEYSIELPLYQLTEYKNLAGTYKYSDFVFDDSGRVSEKKESGSSRGTITYKYDEQGRVLSETDTNSYGYETTDYTYDEQGEIATVSESSDYSIRGGNVFQYTYERDDQNRIVKMTTVNTASEDLNTCVYAYEYDDFGNVSKETQTTSNSTYILECSYDAQGHRVQERVKNMKKGNTYINTFKYECVDYLTMSPGKNSELAAVSSWKSFESQEALPVPDSCVTTISQDSDAGDNTYRLPGNKEAAYLEYLKYQTILSDLCGFTLEPGDDGSMTIQKGEETIGVMTVGYDAKGFLLRFAFEE